MSTYECARRRSSEPARGDGAGYVLSLDGLSCCGLLLLPLCRSKDINGRHIGALTRSRTHWDSSSRSKGLVDHETSRPCVVVLNGVGSAAARISGWASCRCCMMPFQRAAVRRRAIFSLPSRHRGFRRLLFVSSASVCPWRHCPKSASAHTSFGVSHALMLGVLVCSTGSS